MRLSNFRLLPLIAAAGVFLTLAAAAPVRAQTAKPPAPPAQKAPAGGAKTPELAVQNFLIAMVTGNAKEIIQSIVPLSRADMTVVLGSGPPPLTADQVDHLRAQIKALTYRRLKVGDTFTFADGKTATVPASDVTPDRVLVEPASAPTPFIVIRSNGTWRVDAAFIVAARKAAMAQRSAGAPANAAPTAPAAH